MNTFAKRSTTVTRKIARATTLLCSFLIIGSAAVFAQQHQSYRPIARLVGAERPVQVARLMRPTSRAMNVSYSSPVTTSNISSAVTASVTSEEHKLHELINRERTRLGLPLVQLDPSLSLAAREHADDMAHAGALDHTGRDGSDAATRARRVGVSGWHALGENIAFNQGYDDPIAFAVERWMKSVKHRENISNPSWTHTGLGVARAADGSVYFTQVFVER